MQQLQKINPETNVITWFEIPVSDMQSAKAFYETILDIEMTIRTFPETAEELCFFPYDPNVIQATSGRVTGVLTKSGTNSPSQNGSLLYINASPEIQPVLDRTKKAGGKVIVPKTRINAGYIAVILDSEGNRIGLHAEK